MNRLPVVESPTAQPGTVDALKGEPLSLFAADSVVFLISNELLTKGSVKSLLTNCDYPMLGSRKRLCEPICRALLEPSLLPSSCMSRSIWDPIKP